MNNKNRFFIDERHNVILSLQDLQEDYYISDSENDFDNYMLDSISKNGTLTEITKDIEHFVYENFFMNKTDEED